MSYTVHIKLNPKHVFATILLGYVVLYPYAPFSYLTFNDSASLGFLAFYLLFILVFQRFAISRNFIGLLIGLFLSVTNDSIYEAIRILMFCHIFIVLISNYSSTFLNSFIILNTILVFIYFILLIFIGPIVTPKWSVENLNISVNNPIWIRHNISKDFEYFFLFKFYVVRFSQGFLSDRQSFYFIEPFYYWNCVAPILILYYKRINFIVLTNIVALFLAFSYWGAISFIIALLLQKLLSKFSLLHSFGYFILLVIGFFVAYKFLEFSSPYRIYQARIQSEFLLKNIHMLWSNVDLEFLDRINYQYGILGLNSRFRYGVIVYLIFGVYIFVKLSREPFSKYSLTLIFVYLMGLKSPDFISPLLVFVFLLFKSNYKYDTTRAE